MEYDQANKQLHGSDDTAQFQGKFVGPNKDQINYEHLDQKALVEAVSKKLQLAIEKGLIP